MQFYYFAPNITRKSYKRYMESTISCLSFADRFYRFSEYDILRQRYRKSTNSIVKYKRRKLYNTKLKQ